MSLMSKSEHLIVLKGMKFTGSGKLGLRTLFMRESSSIQVKGVWLWRKWLRIDSQMGKNRKHNNINIHSLSPSLLVYYSVAHAVDDRGVTGKFFWGGKVIFPDFFPGVKCFFPGRKFPFWYTQNKFDSFWKVKSKKTKNKNKKKPLLILELGTIIAVLKSGNQKKRKKKVLSSFKNFSLLPFSIFLLFFPPFQFFPCHFFPIGQQKFPGQKSRGALCTPPVTPLVDDRSHSQLWWVSDCLYTLPWLGFLGEQC